MLKVIGIDREIKIVIPLCDISKVLQVSDNIVIIFHKGEIYRVKSGESIEF